MTEPSASMLKRIQSLLARAEDVGATEAERDLCNAKALELMLKYSVDLPMLNKDETPESVMRKLIKLDFLPAAYTYEYAILGVNIAPFINCRGVRAILPKRTDLFIIGHTSDVESVELLYWSLVRQCMFQLTTWYRSFDAKRVMFRMTPQEKMKMKKSYVVGFIKGVCAKLESVRTQVVSDAGHSAEIVLADKKNAVDAWIDEHMDISSGRQRRYYVNGQTAGFEAGYDADIGQPQMGLTRRAIGSA